MENFPGRHSVHVVALLAPAVSVSEPAAQTVHTASLPPGLNHPGTHAEHELSSASMEADQLEPGAHTIVVCSIHPVVELRLNCSISQAVQLVAPSASSVSVYEPAEHDAHADVDTALNCPASHAVQLVAPSASSVSVYEPGEQSVHCV